MVVLRCFLILVAPGWRLTESDASLRGEVRPTLPFREAPSGRQPWRALDTRYGASNATEEAADHDAILWQDQMGGQGHSEKQMERGRERGRETERRRGETERRRGETEGERERYRWRGGEKGGEGERETERQRQMERGRERGRETE